MLAATHLIVRTAPVGLLQVLHFGNTPQIASYVADGDGSDDGLSSVADFVGATGRKCLCAVLGNRKETRHRVRIFVDT